MGLLVAAFEADMGEALFVRVVPRLVEVVHVELADEGGEVVVLEVKGEYPVGELVRLPHDEALAVRAPADHGVQRRVLAIDREQKDLRSRCRRSSRGRRALPQAAQPSLAPERQRP